LFRRIFVANRGEVAARVARTCRRMGIEVVAGVTTPDEGLGWLDEATVTAPLGGRNGYRDADAVLAAARAHRCTALHPGWGFLAENAEFATRCEAERIRFVGPGPAAIRAMGDKAVARATFAALGVPGIPGSDGVVATAPDALREAGRIGYPVLLKAVAGGGGRGMRRVATAADLPGAFAEAAAESLSAFGDGSLYVERLIERGRHVEFQILGDRHGGALHLGERECSVQRRHQKLVEESPSPVVTGAQRAEVGGRLAAACARLGYHGAGTVEMLRDEAGNLWFMEMNTRLQVEHPVTEMVTGVDLVELQLRVAANERVRPQLAMRGHAVEARVNAEDVAAGFRGAPGRVARLRLPGGDGVRVDTHLREGDTISPHYDSMIAKVIAWGPDRATAIARLDGALGALVVEGVPSTAPFIRRILADHRFKAGDYDTSLVERVQAEAP
jgi:acetyl-CoA carboxylase biotin carboxylase subunit